MSLTLVLKIRESYNSLKVTNVNRFRIEQWIYWLVIIECITKDEKGRYYYENDIKMVWNRTR